MILPIPYAGCRSVTTPRQRKPSMARKRTTFALPSVGSVFWKSRKSSFGKAFLDLPAEKVRVSMPMIVAKIVNISWIVWVAYVFVTGFGRFDEPHVHSYVYLFFGGLGLMLAGSIWLKVVDLWKHKTPRTRIGFWLWLGGFLVMVLCIFAGAEMTPSQFVNAHVIFNHINFLIFLIGMIVSVYVDTIIVSRLDVKRHDLSL